MKEQLIIVFIKNAVLGKVKTRLAKDIGDLKALEIYKRLVNYTLEQIFKTEQDFLIYFSDTIVPLSTIPEINCRVQTGENLGQRMQNAFGENLAKYNRVVLIGSDCAELTDQHVLQALRALETKDIVFGPAKDGGYYLIGLNQPSDFIFNDMPWSQDNLLDKSLEAAKHENASVYLLESLSDVDYLEDWEKVSWQ